MGQNLKKYDLVWTCLYNHLIISNKYGQWYLPYVRQIWWQTNSGAVRLASNTIFSGFSELITILNHNSKIWKLNHLKIIGRIQCKLQENLGSGVT